MKIALSTVAALLVALAGTNVEAMKSIPHSLAKAAFTTTKQTRSLRSKEQMRLRKLASQVRPQSPPKRRLEDGADAGYSQYQWSDYNGNYDLNEDMTTNEAFGFDISSYSFHYTGCSAIKAYNDDVAADESTETVLRTNRMATFRLCPTDTCSSNSFDGCNSNYGEYVVSMDDFLLAMVQLQEDRVVSYCEYCEDCAGVESFKNFYSEFQYKHEQILQTSENSYSSFAESYTANLQSSGQYSDDTDFDLLAQKAYYQKLSRGNYANNYVYGNSYNNNYYGQSGNGGYNYQNQEQKYSAYSDNGNGNGNANYYQSYGGDGNSNYYQSNGDGDGGGYINGKYYDADTYETMVEQQEEQTSKNQALWKKWYSFSTSSSSNNGGKDEEAQSYGQFYNSMSTWSSMGAWYGHQIVNGYTSYDDYGNEEFVAEWGFIGYDNAFHSLEDDGALKEWDEDAYGFGLPEGWKEYMNKADELESCAYDSSSSCYNQFFSCMQVLNADEYQEFIEEYNSAYYETMYEEAEEAKERASLTDYLQCTAVDYDGDIETDDNNNNNNENANEEGYNWAAANGNYNSNSNSNSNSAAKYASYQNDDGSYNFYVGPHCDGDTISLGVYVDEYCSQYASGVDVTDVLGYDPMEGSSLNIVPNECVSCQYDEVSFDWKNVPYLSVPLSFTHLSPLTFLLPANRKVVRRRRSG